jgi:hypothetical protein
VKIENRGDKLFRQNERTSNYQKPYSFTGSNLCEIIGDKIYISPMLFLAGENPFQQEVRNIRGLWISLHRKKHY